MPSPHPLLLRALTGVPPKLRPRPPFHLGGATPRLSHGEYLALSLFAASRVTALVARAERRVLNSRLALARSLADEQTTDAQIARYTHLKRQVEDPLFEVSAHFHDALKDVIWSNLKVGRPALYTACVKLVTRREGADAGATKSSR